jgi:hypothetical protein
MKVVMVCELSMGIKLPGADRPRNRSILLQTSLANMSTIISPPNGAIIFASVKRKKGDRDYERFIAYDSVAKDRETAAELSKRWKENDLYRENVSNKAVTWVPAKSTRYGSLRPPCYDNTDSGLQLAF